MTIVEFVGTLLPVGLRLELGFQRFGYFLCGAFAFFFLGPFPLREVVVGSLQAPFGGEDIDLRSMNFASSGTVTSSMSSSALI